MKKAFVMLVGCCLMGCNSNGGIVDQGSDNACQYAKEKIGVLSENIESMEVVKVDSLLSNIGLSFGFTRAHKAAVGFLANEITSTDYLAVLDSLSGEVDNVSNSWKYGDVVNDSLHEIDRLDSQWRRVYTVSIKMKSGTSEECRVMMDRDGITPYMTEMEMKQEFDKIGREWNDLWKYLKDL